VKKVYTYFATTNKEISIDRFYMTILIINKSRLNKFYWKVKLIICIVKCFVEASATAWSGDQLMLKYQKLMVAEFKIKKKY